MIARSKPFARRVELSRSALRGGRITRRTKVRAVNVARQSKAFRRAYGGAARVAWVRTLACVACGRVPSERWPSINAHLRTGGIGRKSDAANVVPLCVECDHARSQGVRSFERAHLIRLDVEAERIEQRWQERLAERGTAA